MADPNPALIDDVKVLRLITSAVETAVQGSTGTVGGKVQVVHFGEGVPDGSSLTVAIAEMTVESRDRVNIDNQPDDATGQLAIECVADASLMKESVYALADVVRKAYMALDGKTLAGGDGHELIFKRTTRRYLTPPPEVARLMRVGRVEAAFVIKRTSGR